MNNWQLDGVKFGIVRGNIANETTDGIAIPVSTNLLPDGPSTGAIFRSASDKLVKTIEDIEPQEPTSVTTVEAQGLSSDQVLLCAMKSMHDVDDLKKFLDICYENVLETTLTEPEIDSLSIMPLGLGDHDFPIDEVARSGIGKILDYSEYLKVKSVKFVIYDAIQYSSFVRFGKEILN
jgi:O-acetyl-ADP-ribose deacetylase (regulator of RNase III)